MDGMGETGASAGRPALGGPRLRPGDRVRVVSPVSTPDRDEVALGVELLTSWGLVVELGDHAFDHLGHYLAGTDEGPPGRPERCLPGPRGAGRAHYPRGQGLVPYRQRHRLRRCATWPRPKPLVGFSDITFLHQALYRHCRLATLHGPHIGWSEQYMGPFPADCPTSGADDDRTRHLAPVIRERRACRLRREAKPPGRCRKATSVVSGSRSGGGRATAGRCWRSKPST